MLTPTNGPKKPASDRFRKLVRYFIQGVIILAPIFITGYALYWLFDRVDSLLRPWVNVPGLGFGIIILFILLVGWVSSGLFMGGMIHFFDQWMERTPVIKFIYSSTKDFFEAFAGDRKKFNKAVLASVFATDVWIIGFLTDEEMSRFELGADQVAVYVPQSYNFAGQLYLLPRSRVRTIERISPGQAMKYAVTGGVVELDEEQARPEPSTIDPLTDPVNGVAVAVANATNATNATITTTATAGSANPATTATTAGITAPDPRL